MHGPTAALPRHRLVLSTAVLLLAAVTPSPARACDVCAIYTATELQESRTGLRIAVGQQFSRSTTLQVDDEEIGNPNDEFLESSITQVVVGYTLHPRFSVQINLPIIARNFRRLEKGGVERDDETGFGDMSLLADYTAYSRITEDSVVRFSLLGGLVLPSGDSGRLKEERDEGHHDDDLEGLIDRIRDGGFDLLHDEGEAEEGEASGIHGHDIALGSGSTDVILGGRLLATWKRAFVTGQLQYAIRTEGDFNYQYANDLTWSAGPGVFALLGHDHSLGAQVLITGETKGTDTFRGERSGDTALTAVYVGPGFHFTWGTRLAAEIAADLPVVQNNSALQIVADFRLRGGLSWRF